MIDPQQFAELQRACRQLERRVRELEAAHTLRGMAPAGEDEATLGEACAAVGIGLKACTGNGQDRETVLKRRVVIEILRSDCGWSAPRIARAIQKDVTQVFRALRGRRIHRRK